MIDHIDGWHFAGATLRDGTPLPGVGVELPTIADPVPCERGYHGSVLALDALDYAIGFNVARVRLFDVIPGNPADKYAARRRVVLAGYVDVVGVLAELARRPENYAIRIHAYGASLRIRVHRPEQRDGVRDRVEQMVGVPWRNGDWLASHPMARDRDWQYLRQNADLESALYCALGAKPCPTSM